MKTPVALIIFNRLQETRRVFDVIRAAKPEKLFIISDGPRNKEEAVTCASVRAIVENIDWPCEVQRNYSETNLGCKKRVSTGIDWVFEHVDKAIILEDDCLPEPTFFSFCEELLERYRDDEKVMHVSGNFFHQKNKNFVSQNSYFFSSIPHIWGWATWKRAWKKYDVNMKEWSGLRKSGDLEKIFNNAAAYEYWSTIWDQYQAGKIDSWDGQWLFACIKNQGICINPTKNLISNVGFGVTATHTKKSSLFASMPTEPLSFPLSHPQKIEVNTKADDFTWRQNFGINRKLSQRILGPLRRKFPSSYATIRNLFRK